MRLTQHTFTLGIEEEFQIIDPESRELVRTFNRFSRTGKCS